MKRPPTKTTILVFTPANFLATIDTLLRGPGPSSTRKRPLSWHYHSCPRCHHVWRHTRERNLNNRKAHTCRRCGYGPVWQGTRQRPRREA